VAQSKPIHKLMIIAPTCFYYQVDLFREIAAHPRLDLKVYFCSDESLRGLDIKQQFNTNNQWGVERTLLEGYNFEFLKNYSLRPSYLKWPVGLMNFSIWSTIKKCRPDAVVLMSWMNPTWWLAILACLKFKVPFFYMTDTNVESESMKPKLVSWIKKVLLGKVLFRAESGFLCAGESNKQFYQYYGVPEKKLVPFAFSWGYKAFLDSAESLKARSKELRAQLGIPVDDQVFLYCGRLSPEKNPMVLLDAYRRLPRNGTTLLIVGDGLLRDEAEKFVAKNNLDSVIFYGFQNRNEIAKFYAVCDALVLPSDREATGGVINEAMCFGLPVVISDQVGFKQDFVMDGYTGFIFPVGNVEELTHQLERVIDLPEDERALMAKRSIKIMVDWLGRDLPGSLADYLDRLKSKT